MVPASSLEELSGDGSDCSEEVEITVNVGGIRQVLYGDVLNRYPETRLAELVNCMAGGYDAIFSLCDDYDPGKKEFYFDRDPDAFKCIIEVYLYGEVHMKKGICPICFKNEMDFWRVDLDLLDDCCKSHLNEKNLELEEIAKRVQTILDDLGGDTSESKWKRFQKCLWKFMEKPESSFPARITAILSFLFILISSTVMCIGTIPEMQVEDLQGNHVEHPTLDSIETVCIGWFTLEYLLRLISSPNRLHFALSFMNIIDVLAILPFYVSIILTNLGATIMGLTNVQQAIQALRIMRIARIFKLARHSSGLQTLTYALKSSFKELGLLLMYLAVGIFVFSALGYTMEQSHPDTLFKSIPQSFWWAIITMTTVGYGDIYPKTTLGKLNAATSFLCGVIAIALPIHPIINNFVKYYNKQRVLETATKHELELMELHSNGGYLGANGSSKELSEGRGLSVGAHMKVSHSDTFIQALTEEKHHRTRLQSCK